MCRPSSAALLPSRAMRSMVRDVRAVRLLKAGATGPMMCQSFPGAELDARSSCRVCRFNIQDLGDMHAAPATRCMQHGLHMPPRLVLFMVKLGLHMH